jgi:hypothetical protein
MENNEEDFHKVKRKMRSYCGLCYQFFENSPFTKVCREHYLKANCNTYDCKKGTNCIRKFPNHNSANRHTYCYTNEEVSTWDEGIDIQKCLTNSSVKSNIGVNNSKDEIKLSSPTFKDNLLDISACSIKFDLFETKQNITINNISEQNSLYFIDKKFECDAESLADEFDKFNFNLENKDIRYAESIKETILLSESLKDKKIENYLIKDDTSIDEIVELVYNATKIPKSALNKLKSAFKKRGLMTAEIIRLLRTKNGNWDFLLDDFKEICTQIQGIAVYLENLLEQKLK